MLARIIANGVPLFLPRANISFSTKIHGGFNTATVKAKMEGRLNNTRIETLYFQKLRISDRMGYVLFEGRIMSVTIGGGNVEIEATGYGISATNDLLYQSTSTTQANVSTIIAEVLGTTYCPELSSTQKISTNTTQAVRFSNHAEYPFEIASRLCSLSDSDGDMWTFGAWEDRIPFYYNVYDTNYRRDWVLKDNFDISYNTSAENLRNSIRVISTDENGAQETTALSSSVLTGHPTRQAEFTVTKAVSPTQARDRLLTQLKRPQASIQLRIYGTVERKYGGKFPVTHIRAGDFVDISRLKLTSLSNTIDLKSVLVLATNYSNGILTVTPGV